MGPATENIADGTSNTILAGEAAGNFKPWGNPENRRDPSNGIQAGPDSYGSPGSPGAVFLFCDGSVRYLSKAVNPDVLKAFATPAGGEIITQGGTDSEISVVVPTSPPPSQHPVDVTTGYPVDITTEHHATDYHAAECGRFATAPHAGDPSPSAATDPPTPAETPKTRRPPFRLTLFRPAVELRQGFVS